MPATVPYLDANGNKQTMPTQDYIQAELEKEMATRDELALQLADESDQGIIPQFRRAPKDIAVPTKVEEPEGEVSMESWVNPYTYSNLVRKPDMVVTTLGGNVPNRRADVVAEAKKNAASVGRVDSKTGSVSVYVDDIKEYVFLAEMDLGTASTEESM